MPNDVDILTPRSFSALTVDQRDLVLREVSKRLHYVALLARTFSGNRSSDLEQLGSKIDESARSWRRTIRKSLRRSYIAPTSSWTSSTAT